MEEENWDELSGVNNIPVIQSNSHVENNGQNNGDYESHNYGTSSLEPTEENGYNNEYYYHSEQHATRDSWGNTFNSGNDCYQENGNINGQSNGVSWEANGYNSRYNSNNRYGIRNYGDDNRGSGFRGRGRSRGRGQGTSRNHEHNSNNGYSNSEKLEKPAIPKPTYIPPDLEDIDDSVVTMVAGLNFDKYENIGVKVSGMNVPKHITTFENSGLRELLLENLKRSNYTVPTPIQKYSLPIVLEGRDMMASAQTGSGKTAAFVLPILQSLLSDPSDLIFDYDHCEPQAVIMSPTRELTIQICEVVKKLSRGTIIKSELLYGGTATHHQKHKILKGVHIIVATPGRLNDFVNRGLVTFQSIRFFVLDEADRMLDMGFKPEIERVLHHHTMTPTADRQTLMFSATLPSEIQQMACTYLKSDYVFVAVGEVGGACKDVTQEVLQVKKFDKKQVLVDLLEELDDCQGTIVFVEQKRNADFIAAFLSEKDFPTTSIHGDREQPEREKALRDFKTKRMKILVATAVAARGLDITGVSTVINFDLPKTVDEYVHRIGRTGRLGNAGKAVSFFDPDFDQALAPELKKILQQAEQEIPEWLEMFGGVAAEPNMQFDDIRTDVTSEYVQENGEEEVW